MRRNRSAAVAVAVAGVAIVSGCGVAQHNAAPVIHPASSHSPAPHPSAAAHSSAAARPSAAAADPSVVWLESAGGQAQVTFNNDVSTLAWDLEVESHSPTVANHLVFEADARVVRAEARTILSAPALLPTVNQAAYERMLSEFIVVANLLQPGPGYGTTRQDSTAWYAALSASDITIS